MADGELVQVAELSPNDRAAYFKALGTPDPEATPAPPEFTIPEKFKDKNTEDIIKSYLELEKLNTKTAQELAKLKETKEPARLEIPIKKEEVTTPSNANLWDDLAKKVEAGESLTDADYETLEKSGVPKVIVDNVKDTIKSRDELMRLKADQIVGGKENREALVKWAVDNLPESDLIELNGALQRPGWELILQGLMAKSGIGANQSGFIEPQSPMPGVPSLTINSYAELRDAHNKRDSKGKRLYGKDEVYTKNVDAAFIRWQRTQANA